MNDPIVTIPKSIQENITFSWKNIKKNSIFAKFPEEIPADIELIYKNLGISHLYKHQAESIRHTFDGKNVVIPTGTASGKSICYQLPIINSIYQNEKSTALMLFPTKALSMDQYKNWQLYPQSRYNMNIIRLYILGGRLCQILLRNWCHYQGEQA